MIAELFTIIAPVLVAAGIGYGWVKAGRDFPTEFTSSFVTLITTPCLVFHSISSADVSAETFGRLALAGGSAILLCAAIGLPLLRLSGIKPKVGLTPIMFANVGNMGLPLALFAFGAEGLSAAMGIFVVSGVMQFVLSPMICAGLFSVRRVASEPMVYAALLGLAVLIWQPPVPVWIMNTTNLIGAITIPLMLITLGVSIARIEVSTLKSSLMIAIYRFIAGLAAGHAMAWLFGLQGLEKGLIIMLMAMPAAVFNYLMAQRFDAGPKTVAGAVMISTLMAFITLPLLLAYVLSFTPPAP